MNKKHEQEMNKFLGGYIEKLVNSICFQGDNEDLTDRLKVAEAMAKGGVKSYSNYVWEVDGIERKPVFKGRVR